MNDTLSLNKLEKIIELEATLRGEYQQKLDEKDASISALTQDKDTLERKISELEQTVATQLKTITEVSAKSQDKQALEQRNRELHNRSDNMKEEGGHEGSTEGITKDQPNALSSPNSEI